MASAQLKESANVKAVTLEKVVKKIQEAVLLPWILRLAAGEDSVLWDRCAHVSLDFPEMRVIRMQWVVL